MPSTAVHGIEILPDGSGVRVRYVQDGIESTLSAPLVVVAVPGNHVLPLFNKPRSAWERFFLQVNYSSRALYYHIMETGYQPEVEGTMIPRALGLPLNGISFEEYQDGRWLLMTDPSKSHFRLDKSEEEYERESVETAVQVFPDIAGTFRAHRLFSQAEKVATFRPGYLDAMSEFWKDPRDGPVYFCGDYFASPSTGGAEYTGLEVVERIGEDL